MSRATSRIRLVLCCLLATACSGPEARAPLPDAAPAPPTATATTVTSPTVFGMPPDFAAWQQSPATTASDTAIDVPGVRLGRRSEEHTSELQSRENLVCR